MVKGNLKYFRAVLKFAFSRLDELFADHQKIVTSLCESVPRSFKKITLKCGSSFYWTNQPHSGTMPYGNLLTTAAIMFSGGNATRILNMMKHLKLACFTERTYFRLQQFYLIPSIQELYNLKQNMLLDRLKNFI